MEYPDDQTREQWLTKCEENRNPFYAHPKNPNQHIWRYMDFAKFVALIDSSELYFPCAENFDDRFEGSISKENIRRLPSQIEENVQQFPIDMRDKMSIAHKQFSEVNSLHLEWQRHWTYISCWHINDQESAAMWKLYAESKQAIAIQSTFERLDKCLDPHRYPPHSEPMLGMVKYVDYTVDFIGQRDHLSEFFHKRKSFAHEQEVRAVIQELPLIPVAWDDNGKTTGSHYDKEKRPLAGKSLKVNLDQLIEGIYVAPGAPPWLTSLTEKIINKYDLKKEVHNSALDGKPLY
ncbi:MAG: hypothetical protein Q7T62_12095 [Undibacterium sp.]|nr:hypothetical protein [Undibacterium sp.]